jgi:hypothetical protein
VVNSEEVYELYKKYVPVQEDSNVDRLLQQAALVHQTIAGNKGELREDNALMTLAFVSLSHLQYSKEGSYGRSWCKRGEQDIFFNMARKFDRLENMTLHSKDDEVGESKVDTVGDEANYGMLWVTYILRNNPADFVKWLQGNTAS